MLLSESPCKDQRADCMSLKSKGYCEKIPNEMRQRCTKSCGFCHQAKKEFEYKDDGK